MRFLIVIVLVLYTAAVSVISIRIAQINAVVKTLPIKHLTYEVK